ncbi:DUF4302 domain-containing protein [Prevotella sp. 10(H)]|uniref:DUF4302 domain-containing protein n=1 Tax=Prevotella sp. 10(H) TaxID=1158294 RepID=UPI0004A70274|nr:DUF4302 domain-containing protein [Prevotella sp. 10(H)]
MKKIIYILLPVLSIFLLQSCLFKDDDVFDDSPANRMNKALEEYREILAGAPNGWLMEYYAETEPNLIGGYTFICKFDKNGNVSLSTDSEIKSIPVAETVTSTYDLNADQGPVLIFDTYNELLNFYTEPRNGDANGYNGDFQFIFMEVSPEKIVFHGKTQKLKIVMTRIDDGIDNSTYLKNVNNLLAASTEMPFYKILINGSEVGIAEIDEFSRVFTFEIEGQRTKQNMFYQTEGFVFLKPVTLSGVTFSNFKWNATLGEYGGFECTDNGVDVKFTTYKPIDYQNYDDYIGTYTMSYINHDNVRKSKTVRITELEREKTYNVENFVPTAINGGKIVLEYTTAKRGQVIIPIYQDLGPWSTYPRSGLYFWVGPGSGSYYPSAQGQVIGKMEENAGANVIEFKQAAGTSGNGILVILYNATGGAARYNADTSYNSIVFTKQ